MAAPASRHRGNPSLHTGFRGATIKHNFDLSFVGFRGESSEMECWLGLDLIQESYSYKYRFSLGTVYNSNISD